VSNGETFIVESRTIGATNRISSGQDARHAAWELCKEKAARGLLFRAGWELGSGGRSGLAFGSRLARVFLLELLDAAGRVDDFLFARIKRMAFRAHLDVQLLGERGARLEPVAAAADNVYLFVFGVDLGLHGDVLEWAPGSRKAAIIP
jgi:hypothetical protein